MNNPLAHFGAEQAKHYDDRWRHTAPIREALHLLTQAAFLGLPEDARILCVGAGTGAEILHLAPLFSRWRFVAVEPSGPMLDICRQKAEAAGIANRCEFHEAFLDSLPLAEPFDAATSILVSQFLLDPAERTEFFRQIAIRLKPEGLLVSADLSTDLEGEAVEALYREWQRLQSGVKEFSGTYAESFWRGVVAVSHPLEVEGFLKGGGFREVLTIYQALFIRAWLARK